MTERVQFVVHDAAGMILRTGQASSDMVAIQAFEPGTSVMVVDDIEGVDRDTFRVVDAGLVRLPPKPAPFMTFDTEAGAWVDPRTDADRASEHEARRSAASSTPPASSEAPSVHQAGVEGPLREIPRPRRVLGTRTGRRPRHAVAPTASALLPRTSPAVRGAP